MERTNTGFENQKDDLANDYLNMTCYPDEEISILEKKYTKEEWTMK